MSVSPLLFTQQHSMLTAAFGDQPFGCQWQQWGRNLPDGHYCNLVQHPKVYSLNFSGHRQSDVLPLGSQMVLHALVRDLTVEFVDHIGASAGVAGQRKHINAMGKLLADVVVPERI